VRRVLPAVTLMALVAAVALPQVTTAKTYRLSFSKNSSRMSWNPTLPNWSWRIPVTLSASGDSTAMMRINTSASLNWSLDQRSGGNVWQDNASLRSSLDYPILGPKASIGMAGSFSSRRTTLDRQRTRSRSFSFSFKFRPIDEGRFNSLNVSVTPGLITASSISRVNLDSTIQEKGLQYNASMGVSPQIKLGGRKLSNSIRLSKRDNTLDNNRDRNESLSMNLGYTWPGEVRTSLSLSESRSERGVTRGRFEESIVNGEAVIDTQVVADLSLTRSTNVNSNLDFKLKGFSVASKLGYRESLNSNTANNDDDERNRFFARDRQSDNWDFSFDLNGKILEGLVGHGEFDWDRGSVSRLPVKLAGGQVFRDASADRTDRNLSLRGSFDWQVGEHHSLKLSGQMRNIRDDNPGAPEQDRDTYSTTSSLRYEGERPSGINYNVALTTNFSHRVNLDALRSSGNSRNRDLRLDISTRYQRLGSTLTHRFGVSAQRTIFDFDRLINNLRDSDRKSNIRRAWNMTHTVRRGFFDKLNLNGSYTYNADDFGTLFVEDQTQVVREDNTDHTVRLGLSYALSKALRLGGNYSYRLDRQWLWAYEQGQSSKELSRRTANRSLSGNLTYNGSSGSSLTLSGSQSRQRSGTFNSFSVKMSWDL
jgi:hypothetical protein